MILQTGAAQATAMETAERVIEQVESDARAEIEALHEQQAEVLRRAERLLERSTVVGVTERLDLFVRSLCTLTPISNPNPTL